MRDQVASTIFRRGGRGLARNARPDTLLLPAIERAGVAAQNMRNLRSRIDAVGNYATIFKDIADLRHDQSFLCCGVWSASSENRGAYDQNPS